MPHSAEEVYLMVMTGGYRAADIERWAKEVAEEEEIIPMAMNEVKGTFSSKFAQALQFSNREIEL
jgi:hypothetical protein